MANSVAGISFDNRTFSVRSRYPGLVALLCTDQEVYVTKEFTIGVLNLQDGLSRPMVSLQVPWSWKQASRVRLLRRLGRLDIRELLRVNGGHNFIATVRRRIIKVDEEQGEVKTVFEVTDGGRPKGFVLTPNGQIFVGEYRRRPMRGPLRIWTSTDGGYTWEVACSLPENSARHIHNLIWDPYRQGIWVMTGDADRECALLFSSDNFQTVSELVRGGQMVRTVQLFCRPEGLYYGTDSERAQNWFVFLDVNSGELHKIQPLPGSCIQAARMAGAYFLSTAVEPSKVNPYPNTVLWSSCDLQNWSKIIEFKKDWLPGEYFGFGNIIFPRIQGECPILAFSTLAVKNHDFTTFVLTEEQI